MAVKIISLKPAKDVIKKISCRGCGATLGYVPGDVKIRNGTDYSGGPDGDEYIKCPNCKKRVILRSW